jgi:Ribbon-helix-helix protein, copG family
VVGGKIGVMRKTSIYIEADVDIALSRRAAREGTTKAEVVRNALRAAARGSIGVKPRARGVFAGPADLAENADEHLTASGFGKS